MPVLSSAFWITSMRESEVISLRRIETVHLERRCLGRPGTPFQVRADGSRLTRVHGSCDGRRTPIAYWPPSPSGNSSQVSNHCS